MSNAADNLTILGNILVGDATHSGTLILDNSNQIANTLDVALNNATATFHLGAFGGAIVETIDELSGSGVVNGGTGSTPILTVGANNGSSTFDGTIINAAGTVALTKTGTGVFTLSAASVNTYTGATTISGGRLNVNGSTASGSAVTVQTTATLSGTGTVGGTINVQGGGHVAPGTSPGILNSGSVSFVSGSFFDVEIGGTTPGNAATNHDQLKVTGTVSLGNATLTTTAFSGFVPVGGNKFAIW